MRSTRLGTVDTKTVGRQNDRRVRVSVRFIRSIWELGTERSYAAGVHCTHTHTRLHLTRSSMDFFLWIWVFSFTNFYGCICLFAFFVRVLNVCRIFRRHTNERCCLHRLLFGARHLRSATPYAVGKFVSDLMSARAFPRMCLYTFRLHSFVGSM